MRAEHSPSKAKLLPLIIRGLLVGVGLVATVLGMIGVVMPVLPTTPFLLLAAACFARSSQRFYDWLLNMPVLGQYIRDYRAGKGIPVRVKITALSVLWITIVACVVWIIPVLFLKALLLASASLVTVYILRLPNCRHKTTASP